MENRVLIPGAPLAAGGGGAMSLLPDSTPSWTAVEGVSGGKQTGISERMKGGDNTSAGFA